MTTVLIADDNAVSRELLREILEARGWGVTEARNGQEVLGRLSNEPPDLVLMDIGMPVIDGYATVREIRHSAQFNSIPVIAVTAYAMQGDREKILSSGFDGYLSKPVNAERLMEELERVLS